MNGVPQSSPVSSRSAGSRPIAARVRAMLLVSAAIASVVLGLVLLFLHPLKLEPYVPLVLFAIGLAVLSALVSGPSREPAREEAPGRTPGSTGRPRLSGPSSLTPSPSVPTRIRRSGPGVAAGSEWRVLSKPTSPGDETWLSWLPRETRRLGSEGGGRMSAVVTSPGRAGTLVAFPVRNYYAAVPPRSEAETRRAPIVRLRSVPPSNGAPTETPPHVKATGSSDDVVRPGGDTRPYSEEELDRMFPPVTDRGTVFLGDAPDRVGTPSSWSFTSTRPEPVSRGPDGSRSRGNSRRAEAELDEDGSEPIDRPEGDTPEMPTDLPPTRASGRPRLSTQRESEPPSSELSAEAANPIPPHLRATGPPIRFDTPASPHAVSASSHARSVCASCSKVVLNLRMSGPCPKCLRPVCTDCLREAFASQGHGWCLDCSTAALAAS